MTNEYFWTLFYFDDRTLHGNLRHFSCVLLYNCELAIVAVVAVGRKMLEMNEESSRSSPMTQ